MDDHLIVSTVHVIMLWSYLEHASNFKNARCSLDTIDSNIRAKYSWNTFIFWVMKIERLNFYSSVLCFLNKKWDLMIIHQTSCVHYLLTSINSFFSFPPTPFPYLHNGVPGTTSGWHPHSQRWNWLPTSIFENLVRCLQKFKRWKYICLFYFY